jgi:dynein heavy chain 1
MMLPTSSGSSESYSALFSYLHYAISPFFDSVAREDKEALGTTREIHLVGYSTAKKKIAELELSLVQLQQNVAIPEVHLKADPKIVQLINEKGPKPSPSDLAPLLEDSAFLNRIQSGVNGWIKEIQKVTLLTRDPSSGSTRQEIEFWLQMERSLANIENQLKAPEIVLSLELLKTAKRFHATVSFIADTGIKDAIENVLKYNQLMKDFPINELLSATDLDKIKEALQSIFSHFIKKVLF